MSNISLHFFMAFILMRSMHSIGMDSKQRHLRCFGHIINLADKAFLFGKDPDAFETEANSYIQLRQAEKELEIWRKLGSIGKLHNVVTYIRRTPQRREDFLKLAKNEDSEEVKGKRHRIKTMLL
jgi:hypothetical protein